MTKSKWTHHCSLHGLSVMLVIIILAVALPTSVASQKCIDHFTVRGIKAEDITEIGNNITINYYMREEYGKNLKYLYSIHWDEATAPVNSSRDIRFSRKFKINKRNKNTWDIYVKKLLANRSTCEEGFETSSTFGSFMDSLTCIVTLKHYIMEKGSKPSIKKDVSGKKNEVILKDKISFNSSNLKEMNISQNPSETQTETDVRTYSNEDAFAFTYSFYYTTLELNEPVAASLVMLPGPISVVNSEGKAPGNIYYSMTDAKDEVDGTTYFKINATRGEIMQVAMLPDEIISKHSLSFIIKANDESGSTALSVLDIALLPPGTSDSYLTETTIASSGDEELDYRITVGIIGGFLGLAFLVGIGIGIYLNYKKGLKFGIIRRRPKEIKTISLLGQVYPNLAMSNTDMRLNARDAYANASIPYYPNYAYANPAATQPAPTHYDPTKV